MKNNKFIYTLIIVFTLTNAAMAQDGYWNNHIGLDIGGSLFQFNQVPPTLPTSSKTSPGLTGSIFFDFIRTKETASRDVPSWGVKFKLNLQTVAYNAKGSHTYYANYFTFPILFKIKLFSQGNYYSLYFDKENNNYTPVFHHKKKFTLYLFAGPQYEYIYSRSSNYANNFSNKALAGYLYGDIGGVGGLEFNFNTFLFEVSWQQSFQPVYLNNTPLKAQGVALRFGLPFNNIYSKW